LNIEKYEEAKRQTLKHYVHIGFTAVFIIVILIFRALNSQEVISAVFSIAGYTYGPLLGLFAFGLYLKRPLSDKFVPFVCVAAPFLTYAVEEFTKATFDFEFGFSKLMLNGFITFVGLWMLSRKAE
jgi:hypothetical protein